MDSSVTCASCSYIAQKIFYREKKKRRETCETKTANKKEKGTEGKAVAVRNEEK